MHTNGSSNTNKYKILVSFLLVVVEAFLFMLTTRFINNQTGIFLVVIIFSIIYIIQFSYIINRLQNTIEKFEFEIQNREQEIIKQKENYDLQNEQLSVYLEEITVFADEKNKFVKEIEESQKELLKKEKAIRNLLNNAAQGFLTFGRNLIINEEYSIECSRIFGEDIGNKYFPALICPRDEDEQKLLVSMFNDVFAEKAGLRREVFISLLPEETTINDKNIKIEYKMINNRTHLSDENIENEIVMVILTDVTESRKLESLMELEKNTLKMIVKVLTNRSDFMDCLNDYYSFCNSIINRQAIVSDISIDDKIYSLYREIHKFKGVFSQLSLMHIPKKLHEIETTLSSIINSKEHKPGLFQQFLDETNLTEMLDDDMSILKQFLGQNFFNDEDIILTDRKSIKRIEHKMLKLLKPNEYKELLPDLRTIRYIKARDLVQKYSDYIEKISIDYEKTINPIVVEGGEFLIDPEKYQAFSQSLVHVFNNAVIHGVESADERVMAGKNESGNIICEIALNDNMIKIAISDDGRGIETEKILKTAAQKGIAYNKENLTDNDIISLIFSDGFSTSYDVTDLSGRGLGLSSLKKEVDTLGGFIEINTHKNKGTTFNIILPYEAIDYTPVISDIDI